MDDFFVQCRWNYDLKELKTRGWRRFSPWEMSTDAGATRRRGKDGFAANGSSEDLVDGMKVPCVLFVSSHEIFKTLCKFPNYRWIMLIIFYICKIFLDHAAFDSNAKLVFMLFVWRWSELCCFHVLMTARGQAICTVVFWKYLRFAYLLSGVAFISDLLPCRGFLIPTEMLKGREKYRRFP